MVQHKDLLISTVFFVIAWILSGFPDEIFVLWVSLAAFALSAVFMLRAKLTVLSSTWMLITTALAFLFYLWWGIELAWLASFPDAPSALKQFAISISNRASGLFILLVAISIKSAACFKKHS